MNEKKLKTIAAVLLTLVAVRAAGAESLRAGVKHANTLYAKGGFNEAIDAYDRVLLDNPDAVEPKFNKANSYYRLDDLQKAMDLYRKAAADSRDMDLVTKARYNLGNCYFQRGSKQRDSDLQKALDDFKTSITHWRSVLDIDPENKKAARNIEVARLIIKDIIDQLNKQQQDPNRPQDPNQQQNPNQQQKPNGQQDPNQPKDPNQPQDPNQPKDPNQPQDANQPQDPNQQDPQQQQIPATDDTAQQILDREQQQKQQRRMLQSAPYQKVDRDW